MFAHFSLERFFLSVGNNTGADLSSALQNPHDGGFILASGTGDFGGALVFVHVARLAADEVRVRFHFARERFIERAGMEREPNSVIHEPSRFLGNAKSA